MTQSNGLRLAIDIGGTFTDSVLMRMPAGAPGRVVASAKTATTLARPADGALEGARRVLALAGAGWGEVGGFIHGTTLATNALIERRGARVATVTTEGFRDILGIGYERRYDQYAIDLVKPDLLVPRDRAFTIGGRMDMQGREVAPLDTAAVPRLAEALKTCQAEAVAVCLLHAYANPDHERRLERALAEALPGLTISLGHEVSAEAREFDRLSTTVANAYVRPTMARYLADLAERFGEAGLRCPILMMTSGGGMTTLETAARLPVRLIESGPAGGAILAARVAAEAGADKVLSFDMGGTTAKLCLIDAGRPHRTRSFEASRAARFVKGSGMPLRIPVIDMIEIGAGGGSIAKVDRLGRLQVGPQSAGADPGPAAFGKGGTAPTVTDADIALGLIDPARFAEGRLAIDPERARVALAAEVAEPLGIGNDAAARGASEIVDESMASAGRMHAIERGADLGGRLMIAFGGNGPLHATRVARRAGVRRILVPPDPGVGSAVGFLHAPVSFEIVRSRRAILDALEVAELNAVFAGLRAEAEVVVRAGAPDGPLDERRVAFMRYRGQGHEIEIALPGERQLTDGDLGDMRAGFEAEYSRQFGRVVPGMEVEVLNWGLTLSSRTATVPAGPAPPPGPWQPAPPGTRRILCDVTGAWVEAAVHERSALAPGERIPGPALIVEPQTTTLVSADFTARIDAQGNILLEQCEEAPT